MRRIGRFPLAAAITQRARSAGFDRIRGIVHTVEHSAIFRRRVDAFGEITACQSQLLTFI
jgi:hypothetical protein